MAQHNITTCDICGAQITRSGYQVQSKDRTDHQVHAACLSADIDNRVMMGDAPAVVVSRFTVEKEAA